MEDLIKRIDVRCTMNIRRLYPDWRQAQAATDPALKADLDAWKGANLAVRDAIIAQASAVNGNEEMIDIDEGWPDPSAHVTVEAAPQPQVAVGDTFDLDKLPDDIRREAEAQGDPQAYLWGQYRHATACLFSPGLDPKPDGYWASRQSRLSGALYTAKKGAVEVV